MSAARTILEVRALGVSYVDRGGRTTRALVDVGLELRERERLAVVGASGSGKSSLAKALVGLVPSSGVVRVEWDGELREVGLTERRRALQLVFQDPGASLQPRMRVGAALEEVLRCVRGLRSREARQSAARALLGAVGLGPELLDAAPARLSGGQRQRVAIARALAVEPRVLVCDEVLSALDPPVQAQVLELLADLAGRRGLAQVFITHDLAVARRFAQRVAVLQAGRLVELGPVEHVLGDPAHEHTRALWEARLRWPSPAAPPRQSRP